MGTEVALSFSALRAQLENEKSSLYKIDENIKKIVQTSGRFQNDRYNAGDYQRGSGQRFGGRNSFPDTGKTEDLFGKRKHETKTVFSRLSARLADSDGEDEAGGAGGAGGKRARVVSAVSRELPSRAAVLRAQGGDEAARTRNRRIFGSLLGTLQKFKQEEIGLQTKEEKKAQVERKIEEQARLEKEREQKERKTLFAERDQKKATIKALEAKMGRVAEFERWEQSQRHLANFILTKAKPHIYWLPKKISDKAEEKLNASRKYHEKYMSGKRAELQEEVARIEARCLRRPHHPPHPPPPAHKENLPHASHDAPSDASHDAATEQPAGAAGTETETGRRRDKFAARDDAADDSDDERHDAAPSAAAAEPEEEHRADVNGKADEQEDAPTEAGDQHQEPAASPAAPGAEPQDTLTEPQEAPAEPQEAEGPAAEPDGPTSEPETQDEPQDENEHS